MKKTTKIMITTMAITILLVAAISPLVIEKRNFNLAEGEIMKVLNLLQNGRNRVESKYCLRNNMKYSRGSLGCTIEVNETFFGQTQTDKIDAIAKQQHWVLKGSSLTSWESADSSYVFAHVYQRNSMLCDVRVRNADNASQRYTVSCDSSAKWQWYPMKD